MAGGTRGGETMMATREFAAHEAHVHAAPQGFIRKWIFSLDHKVIGLQYYFLALTAVLVGMFLSLLMRIHLIWPNVHLPLLGDIKPETYLTLVTMHGTIMVFSFLPLRRQEASAIIFYRFKSAQRTWPSRYSTCCLFG